MVLIVAFVSRIYLRTECAVHIIDQDELHIYERGE